MAIALILVKTNTSDRSNIFIKIFKNHWSEFKLDKKVYDTEYYNTVVDKMINCGDPKKRIC